MALPHAHIHENILPRMSEKSKFFCIIIALSLKSVNASIALHAEPLSARNKEQHFLMSLLIIPALTKHFLFFLSFRI